MKGIRDTKQRIKSVKNTSQITRAMQLVAASKMKRAQEHALSNRPYALLLEEIMAAVSGRLDKVENPLMNAREVKTRGILVMSTDKGLCGPLNSNLLRLVNDVKDNAKYICVGRKATQQLSRSGYDIIADFELPDQVSFSDIRTLVDHMIDLFNKGSIDTIEVLYPSYVNALVQQATLEKLVPVVDLSQGLKDLRERFGMEEDTANKDERVMLFEPNQSSIVNELPEFFLKHEIYHRILEARASEHSARMVAMKTATDNANNLIDDLTLEYNKARQAAITQEILEISAATFN